MNDCRAMNSVKWKEFSEQCNGKFMKWVTYVIEMINMYVFM